MKRFYAQRVKGFDNYIAFNSYMYYKRVVSLPQKHKFYDYLENQEIILDNPVSFQHMSKLAPCTAAYKKSTLSQYENELRNIHLYIDHYIKENNLDYYTPWWYNIILNEIILEKLKCLSIK